MVKKLLEYIGSSALSTCKNLGSFTLFLCTVIRVACTTPFKMRKLFASMEAIGVQSLPIVILSGTFTGMVFALQGYVGFSRFGGQQFIGAMVALGMIRELGPVLTALMVTGRAGSAMAAEIGTMKVSEQVDALITLRINPYQYLVVPRLTASIIVLPVVTLFSMISGIIGGYIVIVHILHLSSEDYINSITMAVELSDIIDGLIKAALFGFIMAWVGCYKGMKTHGGARGVGQATTQSVVTASVLILMVNYLITKLLEAV